MGVVFNGSENAGVESVFDIICFFVFSERGLPSRGGTAYHNHLDQMTYRYLSVTFKKPIDIQGFDYVIRQNVEKLVK